MICTSSKYNFSIELLVLSLLSSIFFLVSEESEDEDEDASSPIPLDDGLPVDFAAIEVIRCLIEHHNSIFTDANETVWR